MKRKVSSSDINKRLKITNEDYSFAKKNIDCENYYNTAVRTNNLYNVNKFVRECAKSKSSSEQYISECLKFADKFKDNSLNSYIESNILPKLENYTLSCELEKDYSEDTKDLLREQLELNNYCDRVIDNHNSIDEVLDIQEMFDNEDNDRIILRNICEAVDSFNVAGDEKVQTAIEEASYLFDKYHINHNPAESVNLIEDYFYFNNDLLSINEDEIDNIIDHSPALDDEVVANAAKPTTNNIISKFDYSNGGIALQYSPLYNSINTFMKSSDKSNLDLIIKQASESNLNNAKSNFDLLFNLFYNIVTMYNSDKVFVDYTKLNDLYSYIEKRLTDPDIKQIIMQIIYAISGSIAKLDKDHIADDYKDYLINLKQKFSDLLDITYPKYNIECMIDNPLTEYSSPININDYKENYYQDFVEAVNIANNILNTNINEENYYSNQLNIEEGYDCHLERLNESDLSKADVINISHDCLDTEIANYIYNNTDSKELNTFLCKVSESVNESLSSRDMSNFKCYYTLGESNIHFYLRDVRPLSIDEDTKIALYESPFSYIDLDNAEYIVEAANQLSNNFNIKESAVRFFSKHPETNLFEEFVNDAEDANISKETMEDIYESIKESSTNTAQFISKNSHLISKYKPHYNTPEVALESFGDMQAITEISDGDYKRYQNDINGKLKRYGYDSSQDHRRNKKSSAVDRAIKQSNNIGAHEIQQDPDDPNNYKDVTNNGQLKNMGSTNAKLVAKGIANRAGDKANKMQQTERNINSAIGQFNKSVRKALVSDRREAIIKGSVIPSFTKCIKAAIAFCGLGAASGFTGAGISKHIGKKLTASRNAKFADTLNNLRPTDTKNFIVNTKNGLANSAKVARDKAGISRANFLANKGYKAVGVISGIMVPVLASYAALCASKKLTRKERGLLMDDIATELQVIDKEIQMADQNNQINKYRALLRLQKDLQRQYNRIRYNIRVGEDIVPAKNTDTDYN